ncbi:rod shape-determining protein MreC [Streptococcus plurextorum]|uniref:rod shape-determining protein MreC n=1 Tax=Streptococcus plurextorum TaxID=456876 RepID=UPI000410141E|nr:rod shape-determining protein MreC [Streptococcus plurextorum]
MKKWRLSRFALVCGVSFMIVTSLIFFIFQNDQRRQAISRPINQVLSPISSMISGPISQMKSFISDISSIEEIKEQNQDLAEQLAALQVAEEKIKSLEEENAALKSNLNLKETFATQKFLTAKVASRSTIAWLDWITVNIGESQGASSGMLVISNGGLIGIVDQAFSTSSRINLLTNTGDFTNIPVRISTDKGDIYGILSGYDSEKNAYIVTKLNAQEEISKESLVVTSGLDGKTAANVTVGKVVDVSSDTDLNKVVYVKSDVNMDSLSYVTLVGK